MATAREDETKTLAELFGALSHPVRIRMLRQFDGGANLGARRLEDAMPDVPLGTRAYHVRQLAAAGLVKPAGRLQRRGAIEHLYVVTPKGTRTAGVLGELATKL